ncbi:MAG: zinc-ribbon domain-containing protein [Coprococcus phoceensis]
MKCSKCGAPIQLNQKYCPNCGSLNERKCQTCLRHGKIMTVSLIKQENR